MDLWYHAIAFSSESVCTGNTELRSTCYPIKLGAGDVSELKGNNIYILGNSNSDPPPNLQ